MAEVYRIRNTKNNSVYDGKGMTADQRREAAFASRTNADAVCGVLNSQFRDLSAVVEPVDDADVRIVIDEFGPSEE